jgi:hypothetical protein
VGAKSGTITGTITLNGPVNESARLQVGLTRHRLDEYIAVQAIGHATTDVAAALDGRELSFSFTEVPFGEYNIVFSSITAEPVDFLYRSEKLVLDDANPNIGGFQATTSLTGPEPWGTFAGVVLINGYNPGIDVLRFHVVNGQEESFGYSFNIWNAAYGFEYFTVGALAYGEYSIGIATADARNLLSEKMSTPVRLNEVRPDVTGLVITGDFMNLVPDTTPRYISGSVRLRGEWPANQWVAVIASRTNASSLGTSAIYYLLPHQVDADGWVDYRLGWLPEGEFDLRVYAMDLINGVITDIGGNTNPLPVDDGYPIYEGVLLDADLSLAPLAPLPE